MLQVRRSVGTGKAITILSCAIALLGGCVSPEPSPELDVRSLGPTRALGGPLPPGCNADAGVLVHGAGAKGADASLQRAVGCLVTTPWLSLEPTIGFTSNGDLYLYPALPRQLDQPPGFNLRDVALAKSSDGGATWSRVVAEQGPVNWHPASLDPFLYVDPMTDRIFVDDLVSTCSLLSFSDDSGDSWTNSVAGCLAGDHQSLAAGPPVTSRLTGYANIVYRCALSYGFARASEGSHCQKSLDGGLTWQLPGGPAFLFNPEGNPYGPGECDGLHHHPVVDHRGWLWVPRGWCGIPYVAVSRDEAATFTTLHVSDIPTIGHDAGVGIDADGVVYFAWLGPDSHMLLAVSHDDGKTWSEPRDVSPDDVTASAMPNLRAGAPGKIAISYLAQFGEDGVYPVITSIYGADAEEPVFVTAVVTGPHGPVARGSCAQGFCPEQYDFLGLTIAPDGTPWMSVVSDEHLSAARLYGAPSLWDESDPDGPYGGAT